MEIVLQESEALAIYDLIDELSGGNAGNGFAWDGSDSLDDPLTRALVKIFEAAGKDIPENLRGQ